MQSSKYKYTIGVELKFEELVAELALMTNIVSNKKSISERHANNILAQARTSRKIKAALRRILPQVKIMSHRLGRHA